MAYADVVNWLLFPGIVLWMAGAFAISLTSMQLSQLFPKAQAFLITWAYAIFLLSGSTFRIWKLLYDYGLSLRQLCFVNIAYSQDGVNLMM